VRPGSIQPVIYMRDGERLVGEMRWGFKLPDRPLFNARSDSVTTSPFWRERLNNRCIVPAGSMLEWKKTAPEPRPKYRLSVKGRHVIGMAGLWGPWMNPKTGKWEDSFAIARRTNELGIRMALGAQLPRYTLHTARASLKIRAQHCPKYSIFRTAKPVASTGNAG